ncbi:metal transporter CNNM4 [Thecamonas trahens ATCC 50062]|uniref:Metal transporter CNNM4 n=1 Tax=Thecamonas trahens ATCC 50062 TaxID=461836 RepID=A0A0L0DCC5_THETB|nr:metal transporter CNNM4 [Thecamonas trahens ATCC 50062]KNC49987.1 metal transporter CNNM4 [Thecamonas trahens ATCC 50062]|eukprot:XP_013757156.1 metal transporter CNNM4 [Thecamonas trahens ATCC 50062]
MATVINATTCVLPTAADESGGLPIYISLLPILFLIVLSGLFSGLTLGLMGLDKVGLEVVMASGTPEEKRYAQKIYPVRVKGNFLLCTLLLGNVAVNALLSILLADLTSGVVGFLLSTVLIVIFGEIMPQAGCSRHGLMVGAYTVWIVKVFMFLMAPLAWPISKVLDRVLGHEVGTIYTKTQLKQLMLIHARERDSDLTSADHKLLSGVLDFSRKSIRHVMTPIAKAFSISADALFDYETLEAIMESGYSRIPVHDGPDRNIDYLLVVKHLALLSPEDRTPIRTILQFYGKPVQRMFDDTTLDKALNQFKRAGHSNLALVQRVNNDGPGDPFYETVGIVTLEDVIEELIMDEIVDETDVYVDNMGLLPVQDSQRPNFAAMLRRKRAATQHLTPQQLDGLYAYLLSMVEPFGADHIEPSILRKLCSQGTVSTIDGPTEGSTVADRKAVYLRGEPSTRFTLVLQGKLEVHAGAEGFLSFAGPYSVLGIELLTADDPEGSDEDDADSALLRAGMFDPNFTAYPSTNTVQIWQITREQYRRAVEATRMHGSSGGDGGGGTAAAAISAPLGGHSSSSDLCSDDMHAELERDENAPSAVRSPINSDDVGVELLASTLPLDEFASGGVGDPERGEVRRVRF